MKTLERNLARRMRSEEGRSVRDIARALAVARSSVSRWVRDIELTADQHAALKNSNAIYDAQRSGNAAWSAKCRKAREAWQLEGRALARTGDPFHAAGCMLYWAEGAKSQNVVRLSNSDHEVLRFFLAFLRTFFEVPNQKVRVYCNLFADHLERQQAVEQFWLEVLELPSECLRKSTVNVYSKYSSRKRQNMLQHGTCNVWVGSTRIVQSIYGSIQEYGGFDRPEWLG